jgi:hypothetical protein
MNRPELLDHLQSGRDRLDAVLATLSDEQMHEHVDGDWTRKDVLAHLEAWERRVVHLATELRAGRTPENAGETDAVNERIHAASRDRTLDDIRRGEREAWDELLASVAAATDDELFDGSHFAWTEGEPFAEWFRGNGDEHVDEHLAQLTRATA